MTLNIQLDKLFFITQELELSLWLANQLPSDFMKRTLARHVLIRAKDFIETSRSIKRPLQQLGINVANYNTVKETYAKNFDEYFITTRDKLSAHVQELDFGLRIELWNDIEINKLDYFVEGALEIYKNYLGYFSIPGYKQYCSSPNFRSEKIKKLVSAIVDLSSNSFLAATDSLAPTRPNTGFMMTFHPIHYRASQLSTIRLWVEIEMELLNLLDEFEDCVRLLKSRILTDIVSFADCFITRHDAGPKQELEGLDKLVDQAGDMDISIIKDFMINFRFKENLSIIRNARNKVGGHFDLNSLSSVSDLLLLIDNISFNLLGVNSPLLAAFF